MSGELDSRPKAPVPDSERPTMDNPPEDAWKYSGVQVISGDQLDTNTPQTPGIGIPTCPSDHP